MTNWLSEAEVEGLTHKSRPASQARALELMGIPYRRRPDGTVLVIRDDLPLRDGSTNHEIKLNLDAA